LYKQSLINTIIMENQDYILLKELTKRENNKNLIKAILGGLGLAASGFGFIYLFMWMIIYFNELSDWIVGIL
jgi:hypothetical protein